VIFIGEQKALAIAVKHKAENKRWSSLKQRLAEQLGSSLDVIKT
jgi:hypothetical protein